MGVCLQKYSYISCYLFKTTKLNTKLKLRLSSIIPMLHMQIIFVNIYENVKNVIHEWGYMYKMNNISAAFGHKLLKLVLKAKTWVFHSMVKNARYHICIIRLFMNINKNAKK